MDDEAQILSYLRTLSICHYVYAALATCFSCFGLLYVAFGVFISEMIKRAPQQKDAPPPEMFTWLFGAIGVAIMVVGLTVAVLAFLSGRAMARRRSRTLSLVVAGVLCLTGLANLIGLALGVFTFIVLLKPETERLYAATPPV